MPKPTRAPMIPSSGFDGEDDAPVTSADIGVIPVPHHIANRPPAVDAPPSVSFAPPMEAEGQQPANLAPAPMVPMADAFAQQQQMAAMREQMARLIAENEQLATTAREALTRPATAGGAPEPIAVAQPEYKLYYIGQRLEPAAHGVPAHMMLDLRGGVHTCARFETELVFGASKSDQYPHAFVTRAKGEWLIANDCPKDAFGNPAEVRYRWSPEAQQEIAEADARARVSQAV